MVLPEAPSRVTRKSDFPFSSLELRMPIGVPHMNEFGVIIKH